MISASFFAQYATSVWQSLTPTADLFVRHVNEVLRQGPSSPLPTSVEAGRRGFVNELAFRLFADSVTARDSEGTVQSVAKTKQRISRLSGLSIEVIRDPDENELDDAFGQLDRLVEKFPSSTPSIVSPSFDGCGIIDASTGDILFGQTLFEIKAADRPFLSADLKQLIVYSALATLSGPSIGSVGLFNPRTGHSFEIGLDEMADQVSGLSAAELLYQVTRIAASGEISV